MTDFPSRAGSSAADSLLVSLVLGHIPSWVGVAGFAGSRLRLLPTCGAIITAAGSTSGADVFVEAALGGDTTATAAFDSSGCCSNAPSPVIAWIPGDGCHFVTTLMERGFVPSNSVSSLHIKLTPGMIPFIDRRQLQQQRSTVPVIASPLRAAAAAAVNALLIAEASGEGPSPAAILSRCVGVKEEKEAVVAEKEKWGASHERDKKTAEETTKATPADVSSSVPTQAQPTSRNGRDSGDGTGDGVAAAAPLLLGGGRNGNGSTAPGIADMAVWCALSAPYRAQVALLATGCATQPHSMRRLVYHTSWEHGLVVLGLAVRQWGATSLRSLTVLLESNLDEPSADTLPRHRALARHIRGCHWLSELSITVGTWSDCQLVKWLGFAVPRRTSSSCNKYGGDATDDDDDDDDDDQKKGRERIAIPDIGRVGFPYRTLTSFACCVTDAADLISLAGAVEAGALPLLRSLSLRCYVSFSAMRDVWPRLFTAVLPQLKHVSLLGYACNAAVADALRAGRVVGVKPLVSSPSPTLAVDGSAPLSAESRDAISLVDQRQHPQTWISLNMARLCSITCEPLGAAAILRHLIRTDRNTTAGLMRITVVTSARDVAVAGAATATAGRVTPPFRLDVDDESAAAAAIALPGLICHFPSCRSLAIPVDKLHDAALSEMLSRLPRLKHLAFSCAVRSSLSPQASGPSPAANSEEDRLACPPRFNVGAYNVCRRVTRFGAPTHRLMPYPDWLRAVCPFAALEDC